MRRIVCGCSVCCGRICTTKVEVGNLQAMLAEARKVCLPGTGEPVRMRVGIHSGPATSGVVGSK